jgi:hypothetical protein
VTVESLTDPEAVRQAVEEFDAIGRDAFLARSGFGRSETWYLRVDDRLHDSKAILGAAHGFQFLDLGPLGHGDFSGGSAADPEICNPLDSRLLRSTSEMVPRPAARTD